MPLVHNIGSVDYWGSKTRYAYSFGNAENHRYGSIATGLENQKQRWETTESINLGLDFGIFEDKLSGNLNYFSNTTSDILTYRPTSLSAGISSPVVNIGELKNSGIELELGYRDKIGDFTYGVNATISSLKSEVTKLGAADEPIQGEAVNYSEHIPTRIQVGNPIGSFFLYQTDGIFQSDAEAEAYVNKDSERLQPDAKAGDLKFQDMNGDGVLDEKDKVYSGSAIPDFEYAFSFDLGYKGFDFTAVLTGVSGNKIYNAGRFYTERMSSLYNYNADMVNAWTPENTDTDIPRAVIGDPNGNSRESTRFLEDGSYMRVKLLQLGYTLPKSILGDKIDKVRFYVSGQDLFTFTSYKGLDPEVSRSDVENAGIDRGLYPNLKTILGGVQITF